LVGQLLLPPRLFTQRVRRPPTDPVNALLSLGYTFLLRRVEARCEAFGLEVALGALHAYRAGRPSLACDLMEPLRVPVVDRWVVSLCNERRLSPDDFVADETHGVRLNADSFGHTIALWEEHYGGGEHERALDSVVQQWIMALRQHAKTVPTLSGAP
jgi:CRISPR-associated protein Cas1